jgi:type III pantothenate kinase
VVLLVDIGNTNVKFAVWDGERIASKWRVATERSRMPDEWWVVVDALAAADHIDLSTIGGAIMASSVPSVTPWIAAMIRDRVEVEPIIVSAQTDLGISVKTDNPAEVGPDRLVDAAAAYALHGGPTAVLDFGTGTTINIVTREGEFIGGVIAPGIRVAFEALVGRASMLTSIDLTIPPRVIGRNTVAALQSGMMFGYAGLVDGLIARIDAELGEQPYVVATGGLGGVFARACPRVASYNPDLTLDGLRVVWGRIVGDGAHAAAHSTRNGSGRDKR